MTVLSFEPETFQQANPALSGAQSTLDLLGSILNQKLADIRIKQAPLEEEKLRLANALSGVELKQKPEELRLANLLRSAQTQHALAQIPYLKSEAAKNYASIPLTKAEAQLKSLQSKYPGLGQPGIIGQLAQAAYYQDHPELDAFSQQDNQTPGTGVLKRPQSEMTPALPQELQSGASKIASMLGLSQADLAQTPLMTSRENAVSQSAQKPLSAAELIKQSIEGETKRKNAVADWASAKTKSIDWNSLTGASKNSILAQTRALGYDDLTALQAFKNNKTMQDLAAEKGIDPNHMPPPQYYPTMASLNRMQRSTVANAGADVLSAFIAPAQAKYQARFMGLSPELMLDMARGKNEEEQANLFAAWALAPEQSALRINAMGGQVGITAIEDLIKKSQEDLKTLGISPSSKVYQKSAEIIRQKMHEVNRAERRALLGFGLEEEEIDARHRAQQEMTKDQIFEALAGGEE